MCFSLLERHSSLYDHIVKKYILLAKTCKSNKYKTGIIMLSERNNSINQGIINFTVYPKLTILTCWRNLNRRNPILVLNVGKHRLIGALSVNQNGTAAELVKLNIGMYTRKVA